MNIGNLLTLRYDPSVPNDELDLVRRITSKQVAQHRQVISNNIDDPTNVIPSSKDLETAIRHHIRIKIEESNPKRITVALSSGVDSNVILSLIRKEFPHISIECINITFDKDSSEAKDAQAVAENNHAGFHEIHVDNPLKDLGMLVSIIKEPRWNVYQYYFIEKSKSFSKVLFTGDGGDELFAGYSFRYRNFLRKVNNWPSQPSWLEKVQIYLLCHERDWVPDQEEMFAGTQIRFKWSSIYNLFRKYFESSLDPLEQVLLADYHGKLIYDFIPTNQKFFRWFDVIGVAPLLDDKIIDMSVKIPAYLKYDFERNVGKIQLREIIKRNINNNMNSREDKKLGFGMDLTKLWSSCAKEMIISTLDKGRIFEDRIINKEWYNKSLARIANENKESIRYISKMLQLLSLEIWYKLVVLETHAHS